MAPVGTSRFAGSLPVAAAIPSLPSEPNRSFGTVTTPSGHDHAGPTGWLWGGHGLKEDRTRPVLCRHAFGSGEGWYLAADVFAHYDYTKYYGVKNLALSWLQRIHGAPVARASGRLPVECSLRKKGNTLYCHLVNINLVGHNNVFETQAEWLLAVDDVRVHLRLGARPARISTVPQGKDASWREERGVVTVDVGEVESMSTLRIDMA